MSMFAKITCKQCQCLLNELANSKNMSSVRTFGCDCQQSDPRLCFRPVMRMSAIGDGWTVVP